jgi:uncharacterized SAM-binding protein YcdF (DUF218 family)
MRRLGWVGLFIIAAVLMARGAGRWIVVRDRLVKSDAIAVLGGNLPFRSAEAARLYHDGWAPRVWITAPETASELEAVKVMGLANVPADQLSVRVLNKYGVPDDAIRVLSPQIANTIEEIRLIAAALDREKITRVIIVTSPTHTRRVRAIWSIVGRSHEDAVVYPIEREVFDADRWWQTARDRSRVEREVGGLAYVWLTLPFTEAARRVSSAR